MPTPDIDLGSGHGNLDPEATAADTCVICTGSTLPRVRGKERILCGGTSCMDEHRRRRGLAWSRKRQAEAIGDGPAVSCAICGGRFASIVPKHLLRHAMTMAEYRAKFPLAELHSSVACEGHGKGGAVQAQHLTYDGAAPDARLLSFMTGALLGDGCLELTKQSARWAEGGSNSAYMEWKYRTLRAYFPCKFTERLSAPHVNSGKRYRGWWLRSATHPLLTAWRVRWYGESKGVPRDLVLRHLDEFALAVWFCDDGCRGRSGSNIYTMAFSHDDVEFLRCLLLSRFGIAATLLTTKGKASPGLPFIRTRAASQPTLDAIIAKFAIPGMSYKHGVGERPKAPT